MAPSIYERAIYRNDALIGHVHMHQRHCWSYQALGAEKPTGFYATSGAAETALELAQNGGAEKGENVRG